MPQDFITFFPSVLSNLVEIILLALAALGIFLLTGKFPRKVHPALLLGVALALLTLLTILFTIWFKPDPPSIAFATNTPTNTAVPLSPPPLLPKSSPTIRIMPTLASSTVASPTHTMTPTATSTPTLMPSPTSTPRPLCIDRTIRITSPISGQVFSRYDSIKIIGAYYNPNTNEKLPYIGVRVEASRSDFASHDDKPWEIVIPALVQGEVVRDDLIASWTPSLSKSSFNDPPSQLPNGSYILRLVVFEGNEYGRLTGQYKKMEQDCWIKIFITGSN